MPILDLPTEPAIVGEDILFAPTFATMLFPRNEVRREQWFAAAMAHSYSDRMRAGAPPEVLSLFHGWIGLLWELPQSPQRVFADGLLRIHRGVLAGYVLSYLLLTALHYPQHCKVERAKAFIVRFPLPGDDQVSESLIEKSWAEFKSVSHLWAAQSEVMQRSKAEIASDKEWLEALGLAEAFRRMGEQARVLIPAEMWTVPEGRAPQVPAPGVPALPPERLSFLETEFPV
jgi:hypothetical protein